jgi:ABC-type transport system involved in multi-copper enzyme maturation permease subunit
MKLLTIIKDTFQECRGKKILLSYFLISTLGIIGLMVIFNVDIAGNRAAIGALFGKEMDDIALAKLQQVIIQVEGFFAMAIYTLGIFLSVFATADLMPGMMTKGRVELYLARPVSRPMLLLGKLAGSTGVVAVNVIYATAGIWLVLGVKTGVWNVNFLYSALLIIFMFAVMYTIMMLASTFIRSTAVVIIITYVLMMLSPLLAQRDTIMVFIHNTYVKHIIEIRYWITPKYHEVSVITKNVVTGKPIESWTPVISSLLIGLIVFNVTAFIFSRKDF